jgi:hypothetical protein
MYRLLRIVILGVARAASVLLANLWALAVSNPIGAIVTAVLLVILSLVILYFKWKWFHNLVNRTAKYLWHHWLLMLTIINFIIPGLGIMIAILVIVNKKWGVISKTISGMWDLLKSIASWIRDHWGLAVTAAMATPFGPVIQIIITIIRLVNIMTRAIKEAGKWARTFKTYWQRATMPIVKTVHGVQAAAGATVNAYNAVDRLVTPTSLQPPINSGVVGTGEPTDHITRSVDRGKNAKGGQIHVQTSINIDGKKVAEATSRHRQDRSARR